MRALRILQFWLFLLFCSYLSLTPAPPTVMLRLSDKLLHAVGYFALYLSYSVAYPLIASTLRKILLLLSYSVMIEAIQHFIPNREFSFPDILANASGLILGLFIVHLIEARLDAQKQKAP